LNISAVGFADTTVIVIRNQENIIVSLRPQTNVLNNVAVASRQTNNIDLPPPNYIANEQIIGNALQDFMLFGNIKNSFGADANRNLTAVAWGTRNYGELIPVFAHQEETKGSRYLYEDWVPGLVVNQNDSIIRNRLFMFNYDKIDGNLLLTADMKEFITVDKQQIKLFALKGKDGASYIYSRVPAIASNEFFLQLAAGSKYVLYKLTKTKFVKANYVNTGLTERGNNYDEYVDDYTYYFVNIKTNTAKQFDIKKRSIRESFLLEKPAVDRYFSDHKNEDINESFVKGLVTYINNN